MASTDRDLVEWLRTQLDADEQAATEAAASAKVDESNDGTRWTVDNDGCCVVLDVPAEQRLTGDCGGPLVVDGCGWRVAEHIALHDPDAVLADIAARRRIVDECWEVLEFSSEYFTVESCDEVEAVLAQHVLERLAARYARRSGYREEWAPDR
jgi:hypothetical protein